MPIGLRKECASDPYYKKCLRSGEKNCSGRITFEHCWTYKGSQVQEKWAIIPLCVYHHLGNGLNKSLNKWFSINRMTQGDMKKYDRFDWEREKKILNIKYEKYNEMPRM